MFNPTEPDQTESLEHVRNCVRLGATTAFSVGKSGLLGVVSGESLGVGKSNKPKVRETRESEIWGARALAEVGRVVR